jgi:glutamyl-tRNA synthetase
MSHSKKYRGRLAPSPTGYLHLGHARTFWIAQERARANGGQLILRNEDLDATRFKMEFVGAMLEDLRWFGFEWSEGPDVGGKFAPLQSKRADEFLPCRAGKIARHQFHLSLHLFAQRHPASRHARRTRTTMTSRFIPERVGQSFHLLTPISTICQIQLAFPRSRRRDDFFRGRKLWRTKIRRRKRFWRFCRLAARRCSGLSTRVRCGRRGDANFRSRARRGFARQHGAADFNLSRAWFSPPKFFHCALMLDEKGERLAKRHDALSLRKLRELGETPESLRHRWQELP